MFQIKCEELVFHAVLPWHRGDVSSMLKMEVPTPKFSLAKIIYPIVKEPRSVGFSCIFHLIGTPYIIAHPIYFRKRNFGTFLLVEDTGLEPVVACLQSRCSCRCANPPYKTRHRLILTAVLAVSPHDHKWRSRQDSNLQLAV